MQRPYFQSWPVIGVLTLFLCTPTSLALGVDCNGNGVEDSEDLSTGGSDDCDESGIPDECEQTIFNLGRIGAAIGLSGSPQFSSAMDFDADGDIDLAIATGDSASADTSGFTLYFNEDSEDPGDFSTFEFVPVGSKIRDFLAADLDGDALPDLVSLSDEWIRVFWNEGNRTTTSHSTIARPATLSDRRDELAAADLDGDGLAELIVMNQDINRVSVYRNSGDKSFFLPLALDVGDDPRQLAVGNLDGDGKPDLVTANDDSDDLSVLINESSVGTLAFSPAISIAYGATRAPGSLEVKDFDNDGIDDVAIGNQHEGVFTLINQGSGRTFATSVFPSVKSTALATGDFDLDGDFDLIANFLLEENVPVLVNDGSGAFRSKIVFGAGAKVASFQVADFDNDQDLDLAVVTSDSPKLLAFLWNGEGENVVLESHRIPMRANLRPHTAVLADLDHDGYLDLATGDGGHRTLSVLLNDQSGILVPLSDQETGEYSNSITAGDYDRDGDIDLAMVGTDSNNVRVLYNDGKARFLDQREFSIGSGAFFITTADLNNDEYPDLISANFRSHSISYVFNDATGSGNFVSAPRDRQIVTGPGARSVTTGDFDGDNDLDLAVANSIEGTISVLLKRDDNTFGEPLSINARGDPFSIVAGDWEKDGDIDLATANKEDHSLSIFHNRGDGSFEFSSIVRVGGSDDPNVVIGSGHKPHSVVATDFSGDGHLDLITSNENTNSSSVLLNDRNGNFFLFAQYDTGSGPRYAPVGDMDLDGDVDLVSANRGDGSVTVLFNESSLQTNEDFAKGFCTLQSFENFSAPTFSGNLSIKYVLPARNDPTLLQTAFQNSRKYQLHEEFMQEFIAGFSRDALVSLTQLRDTREYFIGAVERIPTPDGFVFVYSIVTSPTREEVLTLEEVRWVDQLMREAISLGPLLYAPDLNGQDPLAREAAESWGDNPGLNVYLGTVESDTDYIAYTTGVGYGRLRLLTRAEFDDANARGLFTFQDIVVTDHAPRDMLGVVGGLITAAPQGALSHLPIRTANRGTPNAFVEGAMSVFAPFEDKLVRLEIRAPEHTVDETTLEEAEEFWDMRPSLPPPPSVDETYSALDRFEEMDFAGKVPLETRFGGKATGLARLQTILTGPWQEYRELGFAIPMHYYFEFMSSNKIASKINGDFVTYEEYLTELFELPQFRTNSSLRLETLEEFRDFARGLGRVPEGLATTLADRIEEIFGTRSMTVRFRSSSNVEDSLQFNGAGLYESTSVCVLDSFDENTDGPSHCDPTKENERSIERALKKIWTSLWTFPAHEERAFFRIPQDPVSRHVGMGILVNRAFLDEAANGVAFTADPSNPRDGCYLITSQIGEESVVSPTPGVLAERDVAVVIDGEVLDVTRERSSTQVPAGEFVLSKEKVEELGRLMGHIDQNYPIDTEGFPRDRVLLDLEFKIEADNSLAVKQIRPFLAPERRSSRPGFALEIPEGTSVCSSLNLNSPSNDPRVSYESKSRVTLRSGTFELPTRFCAFSLDLVEQVVVGPAQELALPEGPGIMQVEDRAGSRTNRTIYEFSYRQKFSLSGAGGERRSFELGIFDLAFRADDTDPVKKTLALDESFLTFNLSMVGFADNPDLSMTYRSCLNEGLPAWLIEYHLEDGGVVRLKERFLPPKDFATTGPASLEAANVQIGDSRQVVRSYWDLVYSSSRHNTGAKYWVLLDPPISVPGVNEPVHGLQLDAEDPPEVFGLVVTPQQPALAYLDENLDVLARAAVSIYFKRPFPKEEQPDFQRGDSNDDGAIDTTDVFGLLQYLFSTGPAPSCQKAADANDDGRVNLSDALSTALHLFQGKVIPPPFDDCGLDPTEDALSCDGFGECF